MPLQPYVTQLEPAEDAPVWRFIDVPKFRDLFANEELYFRRTDLFKKDDPHEGLPTDEYVRRVRGLAKYDLRDELTLNDDQACTRQNSEAYFLSCWHLFDAESLQVWATYAPDGVAICSRYSLLKSALNTQLDTIYLGKVRYGDREMNGYNTLQFIFTKREHFAWEREIRAVLCCYDPVAGNNRHYNELDFPSREPLDDLNPLHPWVKECKRRRIAVKDLLTGVVVSPWASEATMEEVVLWLKAKGHSFEARFSELRSRLTPPPGEFKKVDVNP